MPTQCRFDAHRTMPIDFFDTDYCQTIDTAQVFTLIFIKQGILALAVDGQAHTFVAPCLLAFKEALSCIFLASHHLMAQTIRFDVSFINRNITFERIGNGFYSSVMDEYGFISLDAFFKSTPLLQHVLPLQPEDVPIVDILFNNVHLALTEQIDRRWSCRARLHLIGILEIIQHLFLEYSRPTNLPFDLKKPETWVPLVLHKIHMDYKNQVSFSSLAEHIHVSKTTLARHFRNIVGYSVADYILNYRLKATCYLLSLTDIKIGELALSCGFSYEAYFIGQFKKHFGTTPLAYRRAIVARRKAEIGPHEQP